MDTSAQIASCYNKISIYSKSSDDVMPIVTGSSAIVLLLKSLNKDVVVTPSDLDILVVSSGKRCSIDGLNISLSRKFARRLGDLESVTYESSHEDFPQKIDIATTESTVPYVLLSFCGVDIPVHFPSDLLAYYSDPDNYREKDKGKIDILSDVVDTCVGKGIVADKMKKNKRKVLESSSPNLKSVKINLSSLFD